MKYYEVINRVTCEVISTHASAWTATIAAHGQAVATDVVIHEVNRYTGSHQQIWPTHGEVCVGPQKGVR